jgi:ketol-acid reductoisomerase
MEEGMTAMNTVALLGAAGKMGTRIAAKLREDPAYQTLYVEAGEAGLARLREQGLEPTPQEQALAEADTVVLAIPDTVIGAVASDIVPRLHSRTMVVLLDPAAAHAGELPAREDVAYFVVHPCHPPIVNDEVSPEARTDFMGGVAAQHVVCALIQGTDADYVAGERLARAMFAPVLNAHRITVEQMAILEPAMSETVMLTCMYVSVEAIEEAIQRGVPRQVAYDFALGHMRAMVGILFGYIDAEVSDGAKLAVERAKKVLLQPDWKKVFEPESVVAQVKAITHGKSEM